MDEDEELVLPKLKPDSYLKEGYEFWKNYRETLYKIIKKQEQEEKEEKTPKNIYERAKECGIKPTARYFEISPTQVRYYVKKYEKYLCEKKKAE